MNKSEALELLDMIIENAAANHGEVMDTLKGYKDETGLKIVYIAGKVTGLPYKDVYLKFKSRELELKEAGYVVINPCEILAQSTEWNDAMKVCLYMLQFADGISLLHDWQESKGATMEKTHADALGIEIINL